MENKIKDQFLNFMQDWQKRLTKMQEGFTKGDVNVTEIYDNQKEVFLKSIEEWKQHLDEATDIAKDKSTELKAKLEDLQVQFNLGKSEFSEKFEEHKKTIEAKMHDIMVLSKEVYNNNYSQFIEYFDTSSNAFKSGFEVIQLQINLAQKEGKDEIEKVKAELNTKMNEMQQHYVDMQKQMQDNIEGWNKEVVKGMEQFRDWLGDVIYRLK